MTIDRMALKELLEKGSDSDLLREMTAFIAQRLMDLEVKGLTNAAHGERSSERTNQRNGVNGTFKLTHLSADRHFESDPPCLAV